MNRPNAVSDLELVPDCPASLPRRERIDVGPESTLGCFGQILQVVQILVLRRMAVVHLGHADVDPVCSCILRVARRFGNIETLCTDSLPGTVRTRNIIVLALRLGGLGYRSRLRWEG